MKRIGLLGCGRIGKTLLQDILQTEHKISFIQDPFYSSDNEPDFPIIDTPHEDLLENTDLVIESATADVLKENIDTILEYSDLMLFSVTAFSDEIFYHHVLARLQQYKRKIYLPHGAILGVDGILGGKKLLNSVSIETTKNPKSLGRQDIIRTVVYDGSTRGACKAYPRNVNVHATIALSGIGFDETHSVIISDPSVNTNSHKIIAKGEGFSFDITVHSFSSGGVTGQYTPYSALNSLDKILNNDVPGMYFI